MEVVLVGPTFSIEVVVPPPDKHPVVVATTPCLLMKEEDGGPDEGNLVSSRIGTEKSLEYSSDSSIGAPDDSDEEEGDNAASSKGGLASLDSLEESLPIKRGLSNYFSGKSKSFANLSDMSSLVSRVKDVEKPENPFNKRRRLLMANKLLSRKSAFYSWSNPKSMPLLSLAEEEDERGNEGGKDHHPPSSATSKQEQLEDRGVGMQEKKLKSKLSFKSQSCFSLSDLQEGGEP